MIEAAIEGRSISAVSRPNAGVNTPALMTIRTIAEFDMDGVTSDKIL
jgi:hypothetical protein